MRPNRFLSWKSIWKYSLSSCVYFMDCTCIYVVTHRRHIALYSFYLNESQLLQTQFLVNRGAVDNRRAIDLPSFRMRKGGVVSSRPVHTLSISLDWQFFSLVYSFTISFFFFFVHTVSCDANGHALESDTVFRAGTLNRRLTQVVAHSAAGVLMKDSFILWSAKDVGTTSLGTTMS